MISRKGCGWGVGGGVGGGGGGGGVGGGGGGCGGWGLRGGQYGEGKGAYTRELPATHSNTRGTVTVPEDGCGSWSHHGLDAACLNYS